MTDVDHWPRYRFNQHVFQIETQMLIYDFLSILKSLGLTMANFSTIGTQGGLRICWQLVKYR